MLTSERSEKSRLGTSVELAKLEVEQLYPTISMPVTIALFDLGTPELSGDNSVKEGEADGVRDFLLNPVTSCRGLAEMCWGC